MTQPALNPSHPHFVLPATDEMKQVISSVERATNSKVTLFSKGWGDRAIRAAHLAASLVAWKEDPTLIENPLETIPLKKELCELTDLEAWHPFKPQPCPLRAEIVEESMDYFRQAVLARIEAGHPMPAHVGQFMAWAKATALEASSG